MEKVSRSADQALRIAALAQLGKVMNALGNGRSWPGHESGSTQEEFEQLDRAIRKAAQFNGWATEENVRHAFAAWGNALDPTQIQEWLDRYPDLGSPSIEKKVGLILAGNVPLVGLHDVLCVWLSGHWAKVKTSSQEPELIPALVRQLNELVPGTLDRITFSEGKLGDVDAVIATGSNNTARYFEHYFGHLPHIVRKSRVSVAVLDGSETKEEINALGEDVFRYFGLGCRNVSKLYLPHDFNVDRIFEGLFDHSAVIQHNKYANNYDYTRAIWLLDQIPFLENGFMLLKEEAALASPVSAVFYERYSDQADLKEKLEKDQGSIQCVVGHGFVPFGMAQQPKLSDYADGVDTLKFLQDLDQGQNS